MLNLFSYCREDLLNLRICVAKYLSKLETKLNDLVNSPIEKG